MKPILWAVLGASLVLAGCSQPLEGTGAGRDFNTVPPEGITSFSLAGIKGEISGTTISVRDVPLYTVEHTLTDLRNAVPIIGYKGGTLTPAADTPRDFSTPKIYTLLTEEGVQLEYTVVVTARSLGSAAEIEAYLPIAAEVYDGTEAEPIPVPMGLVLSSKAWREILTAVQNGGKYVALDLTACTASTDTAGGGLYGDYTFDPGPARSGENKVVSLVLPDEAERITRGTASAATFERYTALNSVVGAGIKDVGRYAFNGCDALTMVSFSEATTIGYVAFSDCGNLKTVSLPAATSIGEAAFYDCIALETISLLAATSIGNDAFRGCTGLETVSLPEATTIGNDVFSGCTALEELEIFEATSIGSSAFSGCATLTTVSLPAVTSIGSSAFSGCDALSSVYFPEATTIGSSAFSGCIDLITVTFPAARTIGENAFSDCDGLKTVDLPVAKTIGQNAFTGCDDLGSVTFPAATNIGGYAFSNCTKLTTVDLPAAKTIGQNAFSGCVIMDSVDLPVATSIGNSALSGCTALISVSLSTVTSIGSSAFSGCTGLNSVNLPAARTIGAFAFNGCTALSSVNLPQVTSIDGSCFINTGSNQLTVTLGASPPTLGINLFFQGHSKPVTIRAPSGADYGPMPPAGECWGNGFRGRGWTGSNFDPGPNSTLNTNITLTLETY